MAQGDLHITVDHDFERLTVKQEVLDAKFKNGTMTIAGKNYDITDVTITKYSPLYDGPIPPAESARRRSM